jgi:hypothetical protein
MGWRLQGDENEWTSLDAYWLGVIDEVMEEDHSVRPRWFEERHEDRERERKPRPVMSGGGIPL